MDTPARGDSFNKSHARFSIAKASGFPKIPVVQSTRATLIRLTRLTDTSLIVHWFTAVHGLV